MKSEIFRQKNIDKMSSPEDLNDYVKVTSPKVWIIIIAIILLLGGAIVWSVTAKLSAGVTCAVVVSDGSAKCYVLENLSENIKPGMMVNVKGGNYVLGNREAEPVGFNDMDDAYMLHVLDSDEERRIWTYVYDMDMKLDEGVYKGTIVINKITPITFITN